MARLRRLYPEPAELEANAFLETLGLPRADGEDRPSVVVNMVASVDGRAAVDGRSAPLTGPFDRRLFHALRASADAVLVGTRTLSAERYAPLVREPERRRERTARGLSPIPLACLVTRSGEVDFSVPLFDDPEQTVLVFTRGGVGAPACAANVKIVRLAEHELEPAAVLRRLQSDHDVRVLVCEGGPTANAELLRARVVDELFLTVAPTVVGGSNPVTVVAGETGPPVALTLTWALECDAMLFLRYGVKNDG